MGNIFNKKCALYRSFRKCGILLFGLLVLGSCTQDEFQQEFQEDLDFIAKSSIVSDAIDNATITVSANGDDGNTPSNTLDGDLDSRWSSKGIRGKYITYDLGTSKNISKVRIAWHKGDERKAFFQIRVGNSTSDLKTVHNLKRTGSSGKTLDFEEYIFPSQNARYVRISGFGNTDNKWNSISEVQIVPTGENMDGDINTPYTLLGLQRWKLNGLSGSKGDNSYVETVPNLFTYDNPDWFFTEDDWATFQVWSGSDTSRGSRNPRMELRELTADGSKHIFWDSMTDVEHRMIWKVRVNRLPSSGKVCFGQIHDKTKKFDDVIRIQCQGKPNQSKGSLKMRINGFVTEKLEGGGKTKGSFDIGEELHLELTYKKGIVKLYRLDEEANRIETIYKSKKVPAHQNYFKVGNYLQSMKNKKFGSWDYGSVSVKEIQVFH